MANLLRNAPVAIPGRSFNYTTLKDGLEAIIGVDDSVRAATIADKLDQVVIDPSKVTLPDLTISGVTAFTNTTAPGTVVASIGAVPAGATPIVSTTPNDGRLAIGGSGPSAWKVVVGSVAASAGTLAFRIAASGANPADGTVNVTATAVTPTLVIGGNRAFGASDATGTVVATIANVPAGVTPTLTPNDGRLTIGGSQAAGWDVRKGSAASTAGTISLTVLATGANSATAPITVNAANPTLVLGGPLTYAADAAPGVTVATISNVPAGVTPTLLPNDGRLAIGGDATSGWKVVKGLSASTAGTISLTVAATGATSANQTVTVTAAAPTFYALASNRFQIAGDFGTGDGQLKQISFQGGNGVESQGRNHFRRWRVRLHKASTTSTPGIMMWYNAQYRGAAGMCNNMTSMTVTKVEVRAISDGALIKTVTWGGETSIVLNGADIRFNDDITNVPAGEVFLDVYWSVALGATWPSGSRFYADGEYSRSSGGGATQTDYATVGSPPAKTFNSSAVSGADFGPAGYYVKDSTAFPSALVVGDSTNDGQNIIAGLYNTVGDVQHIDQALANTNGGGAMAYLNACRYTAGPESIYNPFNSGNGETVVGFADWICKAFRDVLGQTKSPFGCIWSGHGKNAINAGNAANTNTVNVNAVISKLTGARTRFRTYWPNIPWIQHTITPLSDDLNSMGFTSEDDQKANVVGSANTADGGWIEGVNNAIMTAGTFDHAIDIATQARSTTNYKAWKVRGDYTSTVAVAFGTNATMVTLAAAPPVGSNLTFSPGDATNVVRIASVAAVVPSVATSGAFDVTFISGRTSVQGRVGKAQAAGAIVKTHDTDGLHQSPRLGNDFSQTIIASKSAGRTLAVNYLAQAA